MATCFFPDGVTNASSSNPSFVPCDPSAAHSTCCAVGETCVGTNLCLSSNGLIYRGGCTDKTFNNRACPSLCTDSTAGKNSGQQNDFVFLKPCDTSTGSLQWVCNLLGDCTNSSMRFNLLVGGPQQVNITGKAATSSSSSASTSSTSTSTSTSTSASATSSNPSDCPTTKGTSAAAVGAGVGASLGVLLLLALVWGFWERRKRTTARPVPVQQNYNGVTENKYAIPHEAPDNAVRTELPPGYQHPPELE